MSHSYPTCHEAEGVVSRALRNPRALIVALVLSLTTHSASTAAAPGDSWNLSQDFTARGSENPFEGDAWSLLYDDGGLSHKPGNYLLLPTFYTTYYNFYPYLFSNWAIENSTNIIAGVAGQDFDFSNGRSTFSVRKGDVLVAPRTDKSLVVRWLSPVAGRVTISGSLSYIDDSCRGSGVRWFVDKGSFTLMSGILNQAQRGTALLQQNIPVGKGTPLYLIIDANGDQDCDTTRVELLITQQ